MELQTSFCSVDDAVSYIEDLYTSYEEVKQENDKMSEAISEAYSEADFAERAGADAKYHLRHWS